ncbi:hypothetical protein M2390_001964 [Mycetocola sp. BIGb0189]|uniref:DUF2304 domain-containing protein n=1 Tax=Mycetocola sp. BIGb0189 TaxID=2940604 RepID=UPI00216A93F3|nr:DUF2304 domain-containing protein [Mycetocola sp. BIGb0189]MCS4276770.1 hypothetical protein [Mycetocola sp. BIGb0189]
MIAVSHILAIAASVLILVVVIEMVRRHRLKERHATWWLIAGVIALITSIFPGILQWASQILGVEIPLNLVFFACAAVLFLVCLQHGSELANTEERVRVLTEESALQEMRIRALEDALGARDSRPSSANDA